MWSHKLPCCTILHNGLVEACLLAQAKKHDQLFHLADAIESLPSYMDKWEEQHLEIIRFNLKTYREKYPDPSFNYLKYLDVYPVPERF